MAPHVGLSPALAISQSPAHFAVVLTTHDGSEAKGPRDWRRCPSCVQLETIGDGHFAASPSWTIAVMCHRRRLPLRSIHGAIGHAPAALQSSRRHIRPQCGEGQGRGYVHARRSGVHGALAGQGAALSGQPRARAGVPLLPGRAVGQVQGHAVRGGLEARDRGRVLGPRRDWRVGRGDGQTLPQLVDQAAGALPHGRPGGDSTRRGRPVHAGPAVLRTTDGYKRTGTTFFYDRVIAGEEFFNHRMDSNISYLEHVLHEFDYASIGVRDGYEPSEHLKQTYAYRWETAHEQDSSVVVVDKSRSGQAMQALWWLITKERFKESFWLSFELAKQDYFFSPWGVSVIDSSTNDDLITHNDSLCGSIAHFMPVEDETPEFLYVNGKALLDPFAEGLTSHHTATTNVLYNTNPTHISHRQKRAPNGETKTDFRDGWPNECLRGFGAIPLPDNFAPQLLRRRIFYMGARMGVPSALQACYPFNG